MPPRLLHPFAPFSKDEFRNLVRSDGVRVWDDQGNEYIDALASLWYCQIGHGRKEVAQRVYEQMSTLACYNIFDPWTNDVAEQAAERIATVSPMPDGRVFLCCSGSEAVDSAFKIARLAGQLGGANRQIMLRRTRGYHGVNGAGTSLQGIAPNRQGWGELMPHVIEVDPDDIESAASVFAEHGDSIAGVICEPLQGAGGVYPPTDDYLRRLRDLCDSAGALLIFDEVITGFGRTGSWFASETYGVVPDLITFAKGASSGYVPVGGVIVSRPVCDRFEADVEAIFRHGYTYSGHPAAAAACLANLDIIEREDLVSRASQIGQRFVEGFQALVGDGLLTGYRGVGAIWGAILGNDVELETTLAVRDAMVDAGVICRGIGDVIAFCPPLIINDSDIGRIIDVLAESVQDVRGR